LPRFAGHRAGVNAARAIVEAAPSVGISILTLFAFSSDNWKRPPEEVTSLMWLLRSYLRTDTARLIENRVRLIVIGRRDRIPARMRREIHRVEHETIGGDRLIVRVAIDYSARDAILRARAACSPDRPLDRASFGRLIAGDGLLQTGEVDLLIRTGGERRLSDFMLWESAYAELVFSDLMWPDFGAADLRAAMDEFHSRKRRFGGLESQHTEHTEEADESIKPGLGGLLSMERRNHNARPVASGRGFERRGT